MTRPAAPLIDQLMCQHCGRSRVARACTCTPADPDALAAEVRQRHRASMQLAHHRAQRLARHAIARSGA